MTTIRWVGSTDFGWEISWKHQHYPLKGEHLNSLQSNFKHNISNGDCEVRWVPWNIWPTMERS